MFSRPSGRRRPTQDEERAAPERRRAFADVDFGRGQFLPSDGATGRGETSPSKWPRSTEYNTRAAAQPLPAVRFQAATSRRQRPEERLPKPRKARGYRRRRRSPRAMAIARPVRPSTRAISYQRRIRARTLPQNGGGDQCRRRDRSLKPEVAQEKEGPREWTMRVCIQPFCQRTRCANQLMNSWGASSQVSDRAIPRDSRTGPGESRDPRPL